MAESLEEFSRRFRAGDVPSRGPDTCCECGRPLDYHHDEPGYSIVTKSRGKIRIVSVPAGEAPLEIRQKWVGVEIPTVCFESATQDARGVLSKTRQAPVAQYLVLQTAALEALAKHDPAAAAWWQKAGFPVPEKCFGFKPEEVLEIEPVAPRY